MILNSNIIKPFIGKFNVLNLSALPKKKYLIYYKLIYLNINFL